MIVQPEPWLPQLQQRWLRPRGAMAKTAYTVLYVVNWVLIRLLFRVSVDGQKHLPVVGPFIVTPNHASPLDPPVLAAVLPLNTLHRTYWAGKKSTVLPNWTAPHWRKTKRNSAPVGASARSRGLQP